MRIKYRLIVYKDLLAWESVKAENMFYSNIVKNNWKEKKKTQCVRFGTASRMIQATLNKSLGRRKSPMAGGKLCFALDCSITLNNRWCSCQGLNLWWGTSFFWRLLFLPILSKLKNQLCQILQDCQEKLHWFEGRMSSMHWKRFSNTCTSPLLSQIMSSLPLIGQT